MAIAPVIPPQPTGTADSPTDRPRTEPGAPAERPTGVNRRVRWWADGWMWLAAVVVTAGRWLEAADRHAFHVAPDEPGQLAMARWMSGGTRWNMFDHLTWRPGYAVIVTPLAWLFDGGTALVRAALTLNAVLAGASAVVLVLLLRGWTDLGPRGRAGVAAVTALAPAAISASAYTWAEALITLTFLATLLAIQQLIDRAHPATAITAVVVAAFAMTVHGRSLPMLPVTAGICAVLLIRRGRWRAASATVGLAAVLGVASLRFTEWVVSSVWDDPSDANTADTIIERLDAPVALLDSLAGQSWYQLVASLGMVGIGTAVVLAAFVRPQARFGRWHAATLVALTAPLVFASVTFMSDRTRSDQLVYGRYVDAIVWPITALGLAWTVRRLRPTADLGRSVIPIVVGVVTVGTGVIVALRHGDTLAGDVGLRMMVPGLLPYIGGGDGVPVLRITAVATMAVGLLALVGSVRTRRRVPRTALAVAAVVLVSWSAVRVHDAQTEHLDSWEIGDEVAEMDSILPPGTDIGVVMVRDTERPSYTEQRQRFAVYQLFLPDHEFVWERTPGTYRTTFILAPSGTAPLVRAGGLIRWRDPAKPMALWELPDDERPPVTGTG